ncbi:CoB--CoM heterodisulfide reductase iron-sulfur subunit A family protein [Archaeoglobales archaeon]|nr:MAG: CoB--CoM heterodisulfide reductase iron-sulfur subunit A family protein [Archaeoglobales archaeon]
MGLKTEYDALIIGGGYAGMEASLTLGDSGFNVLLVEKEPSIGGHLIQISKVFPTTDCAGCITTPKMAAVPKHPNVDLLTYTEVTSVEKVGSKFRVKLLKKPRYVDEAACIGCGRCEDVCPVLVPKEYEYGLIGRKAVYIPFEMASPKIALVDLDNCIMCGRCERECPKDAINFLDEPKELTVETWSIIIATGYELFQAEKKVEYGYVDTLFEENKNPNVIHAFQFERLLAPSRPYHTLLRPGDGKVPEKVAFVLCTGSRDKSVGNPICSRVCCMYSIKQALLYTSAIPFGEATIYYMDIRAFGKGFEEFYNMVKEIGVRFVRGKVAKIEVNGNGNPVVVVEDTETGEIEKEEYDLVVLAVGLLSNGTKQIAEIVGVETDEYGFILQPDVNSNPAKTSMEGVFVAGTAAGPMDLPDSIALANAAVSQCISYLKQVKG